MSSRDPLHIEARRGYEQARGTVICTVMKHLTSRIPWLQVSDETKAWVAQMQSEHLDPKPQRRLKHV